jgi:signal transduction histidine kinase
MADNDRTKYAKEIEEWENTTPAFRRASARIGLQGKLVASFVLLLTLAVGGACWMFMSQSSKRLQELLGEQALQVSGTLALASEGPMRKSDIVEMKRIGQDLIKSRNVLYVAFLNADGKPHVVSSRDLDLNAANLKVNQESTTSLMQVRRRNSHVLGDYVEVVAPVLTSMKPDAGPSTGSRLIGFVAVGMSTAREEAQIQSINFMVMGYGGLIALVSVPLAYLLVRRVFLPIRELVGATRRITSGDLDAHVAIHRPDVIGDLARSFNEMVQWVKQQRQDIVAANEKLAEANRELEHRIEQRTAQLAVANDRLSQEIADKEDFLRAVSHDLNAPLRNIDGMVTMLMMKHKEKLDDDISHRLERIKKNVQAETDLISELLELSRIKSRRQKLEMVETEALVWDLRGMFEGDLKSKGIELVLDTALPVVHVERARIRQVFQNLIDNAIKYMGDSVERRIHIGCTIRVTEAEFYVRDTGIGIHKEDLGKVFFVFRRGRSADVQKVTGKGIGLASVKSIVQTYSGRIWVESEWGKGSTFRFTLNGKYVPSATSMGPSSKRPIPAPAKPSDESPVAQDGKLETCALSSEVPDAPSLRAIDAPETTISQTQEPNDAQ